MRRCYNKVFNLIRFIKECNPHGYFQVIESDRVGYFILTIYFNNDKMKMPNNITI